MSAAAQSHHGMQQSESEREKAKHVPFKDHDKTIMKVSSFTSPKGPHGEKYLASAKKVAMRLWENEPPSDKKPESVREYEVVGYVISGRAELHIEGQLILLEPGDSWMVPAGAHHTYRILETFTAVEATSPPSYMYGRDKDAAQPAAAKGAASSASKH